MKILVFSEEYSEFLYQAAELLAGGLSACLRQL